MTQQEKNILIVENIRRLCREKNTSLTKLELKLGMGNGVIGRWAKAKNGPSLDKLELIAKELQVPLKNLTSEEKKPVRFDIQFFAENKENPTNEKVDEVISMLNKLTPENRSQAEKYLAFLLSTQDNP